MRICEFADIIEIWFVRLVDWNVLNKHFAFANRAFLIRANKAYAKRYNNIQFPNRNNNFQNLLHIQAQNQRILH